MIEFSLIDVASISSNIPRSNFSESSLNELADLFLSTGGLVKPILLKKERLGYSVLAGHFEYYVVVRAGEKDRAAGEMVQAFVISPEVEDFAVRQATDLQEITSGVEPDPNKFEEILHRLFNLESQTQQRFSEIDQNISKNQRELETKIKSIEKQYKEKVDLLTMLNTYDEKQLSIHFQKNRVPNYEKLLNSICTERNKKENCQFDSYSDVFKSVKGLGEKTFLILLDSCRRTD